MNKPKDRPILLQVFLSQEEREILDALTAKFGLSRSSLIRLLLRKESGEVRV